MSIRCLSILFNEVSSEVFGPFFNQTVRSYCCVLSSLYILGSGPLSGLCLAKTFPSQCFVFPFSLSGSAEQFSILTKFNLVFLSRILLLALYPKSHRHAKGHLFPAAVLEFCVFQGGRIHYELVFVKEDDLYTPLSSSCSRPAFPPKVPDSQVGPFWALWSAPVDLFTILSPIRSLELLFYSSPKIFILLNAGLIRCRNSLLGNLRTQPAQEQSQI